MKIRRISAYKIAYGSNRDDLEFEVNVLIQIGYQPIGKIMIKDDNYYLEMGIPAEDDSKESASKIKWRHIDNLNS